MKKILYVINQTGEREVFSAKKVERASRRVGASRAQAKEIARQIESKVFDGITTAEIFRQVRALLRKDTLNLAIKFSLKQAMQKMGPAGFYFEKFIGAVYEEAGYNVKINQIVAGKCIRDYEIDFVAKKREVLKIGECKYRNQPGNKLDLAVALANHARFLDIQHVLKIDGRQFLTPGKVKVKSVVVTNTKFSEHAIRYSECMGVELLGWNYPKGRGLETLIDKYKLYPVTILPSLSRGLAERFSQKDIMLAKDIAELTPNGLRSQLGVSSAHLTKLINQAKTLLNG